MRSEPVEIVSARTSNTKTLLLPDNKRKLITSIAPKHYLDQGSYRDLNTAIAVKGENFVADQLPFSFTIHKLGIGYDYTSKTAGTITVVLDSVGGSKINGEQFFIGERTGSEVLFRDVAEGLDLKLLVYRNGIRTYRILKSDKAAKEWVWRVSGDEAGLSKVSQHISGRDAAGRELSGLSLTVKDGVATETWDGSVVSVNQDRIKSVTNDAQYPVTIDPDVTEVISANLDDGFIKQYGPDNFYNSLISFSASPSYLTSQYFRFLSVAVNQGQTIALAELILQIDGLNSIGVIYGLDYDDCPDINSVGGWSGATRTTASTTFNPGSTGSHAFDVTAIVQEIVNRGGWASGNDLGFIIDATSGSGNTDFEDYSDGGSGEAQLEITLAAGNPHNYYAQQQ